MRSIACAIISFVCLYTAYNARSAKDTIVFRAALFWIGIGVLIAAMILMIIGL